MKNYDEFYDFMEQYTDFYAEVSENEKVKMDALASEDLELINKVLADYQVFVSKAENYEKRREELFKKIGLDGKTFREIVDAESGDRREELEDLFCDFRDAVIAARDYNSKSLDIVKKNLKEMGMQDYDINDPACYDKSGNVSEKFHTMQNILDRQA
ncbi:MAG: hypothetical protein IKN85_11325 [Oscillospiraceae bacterium]|nr:hypothetical protein [Oscillospiraceae bacterium]